MEAISVHVVKYRDRDNLVMRYVCPLTGKQVQRSTGTTRRKEAEKVAAKWEAELQEGRYHKPDRMGWEEFCSVENLIVLAPNPLFEPPGTLKNMRF